MFISVENLNQWCFCIRKITSIMIPLLLKLRCIVNQRYLRYYSPDGSAAQANPRDRVTDHSYPFINSHDGRTHRVQ